MNKIILIILTLFTFSCEKEYESLSFENTVQDKLLISVDRDKQDLQFGSDMELYVYYKNKLYDNDREYSINNDLLIIHPCAIQSRTVTWRYKLIDQDNVLLNNNLFKIIN